MIKRVRIKLCGMTRQQDIHTAAALGIDAIGLIFYPNSPRAISIGEAKGLLSQFPVFMSAVAVFVNPEKKLVEEVIAALPIQYLQFHGDESPDFCEQFALPYIKAIPASSKDNIIHLASLYGNAAAILLDTPSITQRGGSGQVFDWQVIPESLNQPIILAGGLTPQNIRQAVQLSSISAIDVCSGVELSPGIKCPNKMKELVNIISQLSGPALTTARSDDERKRTS
ncbi:phosphoribosylanthranilate isomerase [Legionella londiniensis]|uniref:N-(5'-phosphoribosyl)anthranilate isomerase n=1 Tax=Legionella londiniensis TaxID=45068 RepID=A0A0W0VN92_9GAMM|nr:phosphoribosylanthranilate isomerase [Legionella londiniensis]KTD21551.1 N-(5'-phosphoribosyl)anthranilate isomerase [Legionella londiniensis]STX92772.1 N-(5'-phosphoribosyl)anthranilate isomerase [Legionella londiniensis]